MHKANIAKKNLFFYMIEPYIYKAKVRDVEAYAGEADERLPLGDEKIDGIEESDAVLLEEEEFADPDDAVIEVKEDVKVENDGAVQIFKEAVGVEDK